MKIAEKIKFNRLAIIRIVESNNTLYPRILRNDLIDLDFSESHLNIVVDRTSEFDQSDVGKIQQQLENLLGTSVGVFTPNLIPDYDRERVLAEAIPI